jgi:hypothetical protein
MLRVIDLFSLKEYKSTSKIQKNHQLKNTIENQQFGKIKKEAIVASFFLPKTTTTYETN